MQKWCQKESGSMLYRLKFFEKSFWRDKQNLNIKYGNARRNQDKRNYNFLPLFFCENFIVKNDNFLDEKK